MFVTVIPLVTMRVRSGLSVDFEIQRGPYEWPLGLQVCHWVPQDPQPLPTQPHFLRFTHWVPIYSSPRIPVGWPLEPERGGLAGE